MWNTPFDRALDITEALECRYMSLIEGSIARDASELAPGEVMDRYYALLQKDIEAQPSNYLWSHKRWKNLYDYK